MTVARVAGEDFELDARQVERTLAGVDPEPIREHYVVVGARRYPPKQVVAAVTGLDRADFTTHQARSILRRLGFGVYRRQPARPTTAGQVPSPRSGTGSAGLEPYVGRWVAQDGVEILFDADSPQAVLRWLRRHGLQGRVWRIPGTSAEAGSTLSNP